MKCIVNNNELKIRSDFSFIQTRRKNKNYENEYIVTSYIYSDKPLLEYEKEKVSEWITARINNVSNKGVKSVEDKIKAKIKEYKEKCKNCNFKGKICEDLTKNYNCVIAVCLNEFYSLLEEE